MTDELQRCWCTVDLDKVRHNVRLLRERAGAPLLAAVKADGYGHGDVAVAQALQRDGTGWFGVSNLEEARRLRKNGIDASILIFGPTPARYAQELCNLHIAQTVHSAEYAQLLSRAASEAGVRVDTHIKFDTGMGRIGFRPEVLLEASGACALPGLRTEGIYTHFACADGVSREDRAYTQAQFDSFTEAVTALEKAGHSFRLRHCCNSAATIQHTHMALDMVRCGIAVYGLLPSLELRGQMRLQPALEWRASVTMVKEVPARTFISYGRTFQTQEPARLATVSVGYADGYLRALGNRGTALVRGRPAQVAGRVCMDQLVLDVTHIPGVQEGDVVTLCGTDGENAVSLDDIARLCGTINYETACMIGKRVPRVYLGE